MYRVRGTSQPPVLSTVIEMHEQPLDSVKGLGVDLQKILAPTLSPTCMNEDRRSSNMPVTRTRSQLPATGEQTSITTHVRLGHSPTGE